MYVSQFIRIFSARIFIFLASCVSSFFFPGLILAQDAGTDVGMTISVGSEYLPGDDGEDGSVWQTVTVAPDVSMGKFFLGLGGKLRFRLSGSPTGREIEIRKADWVPVPGVPGRSFFDLLLPVIRYVQYGTEGEPLVVRFGSFDNATLGTGFIMGEFSNTRRLPHKRLFGSVIDVDGTVFSMPFIGFQSIVSTLPSIDVVGGRAWGRPLYNLSLPLVSFLQIGATAAADFDPFRYESEELDGVSVSALGIDVLVPLIATNWFSLSTHSDLVSLGTSEDSTRSVGTMIGISGRIIDRIRYGLQMRITDSRFIPIYFDSNYDILRPVKYRALLDSEQSSILAWANRLSLSSWGAGIGVSLLDFGLEFNFLLSGPLGGEKSSQYSDGKIPINALKIKGDVQIKDVLIPGISFDLSYEKLGPKKLNDLVSSEDLIIQTRASYMVGNTVISASYSDHYDQAINGLNSSMSVASAIKLF